MCNLIIFGSGMTWHHDQQNKFTDVDIVVDKEETK